MRNLSTIENKAPSLTSNISAAAAEAQLAELRTELAEVTAEADQATEAVRAAFDSGSEVDARALRSRRDALLDRQRALAEDVRACSEMARRARQAEAEAVLEREAADLKARMEAHAPTLRAAAEAAAEAWRTYTSLHQEYRALQTRRMSHQIRYGTAPDGFHDLEVMGLNRQFLQAMSPIAGIPAALARPAAQPVYRRARVAADAA